MHCTFSVEEALATVIHRKTWYTGTQEQEQSQEHSFCCVCHFWNMKQCTGETLTLSHTHMRLPEKFQFYQFPLCNMQIFQFSSPLYAPLAFYPPSCCPSLRLFPVSPPRLSASPLQWYSWTDALSPPVRSDIYTQAAHLYLCTQFPSFLVVLYLPPDTHTHTLFNDQSISAHTWKLTHLQKVLSSSFSFSLLLLRMCPLSIQCALFQITFVTGGCHLTLSVDLTAGTLCRATRPIVLHRSCLCVCEPWILHSTSRHTHVISLFTTLSKVTRFFVLILESCEYSGTCTYTKCTDSVKSKSTHFFTVGCFAVLLCYFITNKCT